MTAVTTITAITTETAIQIESDIENKWLSDTVDYYWQIAKLEE